MRKEIHREFNYPIETVVSFLEEMTRNEGKTSEAEVLEEVDLEDETDAEKVFGKLRTKFRELRLVTPYVDEMNYTRLRANPATEEFYHAMEEKGTGINREPEESTLDYELDPDIKQSIDSILEREEISPEEFMAGVETYLRDNYLNN